MKTHQIILNEVNLHYASIGYKDRSIKTMLNNIVQLKPKSKVHDIHALKNINLKITQGERIGLIGHNGAGKSTFLKTIAGLYPISSGEIQVEGTIRALLDLSLGFEPDATGRENILYRGLLLGVAPKMIHALQEEIIHFAEIGDFIDYPIKTYSAGMLVRLAFAISTSFEGDILLLDEVIGAGDANFMAKARQRILGLIEKAKILILASHDFSSLSAFCERGCVFHKGELAFDGRMADAIAYYKQLNGLGT